MAREKPQPCEWTSEAGAFKAFATHKVKTESARHIKPLHWYVACRLVIEGGFHPDAITPRPPFKVEKKRGKGKGSKPRYLLSFDPTSGGKGEQAILGGLKTKNVDVVVNLHQLGPVLAVSCKGVTKSFRNLTNRMEETIGECTNLHITYPAMVIGYFALLRANRTEEDAADAPDLEEGDAIASEQDEAEFEEEVAETIAADTDTDDEQGDVAEQATAEVSPSTKSTANDLAVDATGNVVEGIKRFHDALRDMTGRRGIRDEISRYEAMAMVLVEPKGLNAGDAFAAYPEAQSVLHNSRFFESLYRRYDERFIYGAPLLVTKGTTPRVEWDPASPALNHKSGDPGYPGLDYEPRLKG